MVNILSVDEGRAELYTASGQLIQKYTQKDDDTLTRFLLYRDLRTKGYVVKDGFGFDSDFRVYEKGNYGKKDAKFLIFAFNEGTQQKIGKLYKNIQEITQMGKELMFHRLLTNLFPNPSN